MLKLLGAWNLPAGVWGLLIVAVVLIAVGFVINIIAGATRFHTLFVLGAVLVVGGVISGILAAAVAGRDSKP